MKQKTEIGKEQLYLNKISSPVGLLNCITGANGVTHLLFDGDAFLKEINPTCFVNEIKSDLIVELEKQLDLYFKGELINFTIPLDLKGTEFQQNVWKQLTEIPYGSTRTYGQLAILLGNHQKIRAVANANARNKIMILIPCHRVIGEGNKLTGYRGGVERKKWLINFEQENLEHTPRTTLF